MGFMLTQAKHDQQKVINEKNLLKIEKDRVILNISLALAVLLCSTVILVYIYQRKLLRKDRTILRNEEEIKRNILQLHENKTTIRRNRAQIATFIAVSPGSVSVQKQWLKKRVLQADERLLKEEQNKNITR